MGNDQSRSSSAGKDQDTQEKPPDYYELLQIHEDATDDEIKVSCGDELHLVPLSHPIAEILQEASGELGRQASRG